jgi:hypothetical protein
MPLPRSLDPLPAESLPGYVLRLAHRLDMSPGRLAALTGLGNGRRQSSVAYHGHRDRGSTGFDHIDTRCDANYPWERSSIAGRHS